MVMKLISRNMVKPAEQHGMALCMPLTEVDQISVVTHASYIYVYDKPTQEDYWLNPSNNKIMDTLKDSLSRILVPFYPLAGRLGWIGRGRMKLMCNAAGAELIEVESTMEIADFGDFYSSGENLQNLLVQLDYYGKPIQDLPLLAVQITRFACGGLSLGISLSHVVADGRGAFHFIEEWARLARVEPLQVAPFLDRRLLQVENHVDRSITSEEEIVENENRNYFSKLEKGKQATPTFVILTKDKIEQLKEVANGTNNIQNGRPYSRFEVIAAHVWRCVCKARELKSEDITSFTVLVDARARMDPPLPSSYFGNAVLEMQISSCAGELVSKPLSYACSKIREASMKVTNEYVSEYIEHLKNQKSLTKYQYIDDRGKVQGPSTGENNVTAISWLNLVARGVDFGWGNEIYMGPSIVYGCDGDIMIIPYNGDDGSVLVGVFLQPKKKFQDYMNVDFPQM